MARSQAKKKLTVAKKASASHPCGICGKSISPISGYQKVCNCCQNKYYLHPRCAKNVYNRFRKQHVSKHVIASTFNCSNYPLNCFNCVEDCFYCHETHRGKF